MKTKIFSLVVFVACLVGCSKTLVFKSGTPVHLKANADIRFVVVTDCYDDGQWCILSTTDGVRVNFPADMLVEVQ
jgi:hypothetical protein